MGGFIETDLCAHRAESPAELVARQSAAWDPLLAWAAEAHRLTPSVVTGIIAARADPAMREHLAAYARALDDFSLTALAQGAGLSGSAVIALALLDKRLSGKAAFEAAALDNLSFERWGEDAEARAKLDRQAQEFDNITRFIETLG